jgi:hypothetical protein
MNAGFLWLGYFAVNLFDTVAGILDADQTHAGITKGVGVEGNKLIVALFGQKPSLAQLDIYNISTMLIYNSIVLAGILLHNNPALLGLGFGALLADGGLHLVGLHNWKYLIAGGNPNPNQTAWQKFLGWF